MSETQFQVDQKIVYPSHGVGIITEIFEKNFHDKPLLYYKIYIEISDMVVLVPVEKAAELGIRAVVSAEEAQKALDLLSDEFEPITSDWKLRLQMNLELLKKGTIADIARIVRCLYNRSKVKELPIMERKLYDSAKKLLIDEAALAMQVTEKEIEAIVHAKLEPPDSEPQILKMPLDEDDEDDDLMSDVTSSSDDSDDEDDDDEEDEENEDDEESDENDGNGTASLDDEEFEEDDDEDDF